MLAEAERKIILKMAEDKKPSILLVEDEENLHEALKLNLELEGYEVSSAYDGAAALKAIGSEYFDLLILDVMLPEIDGIIFEDYGKGFLTRELVSQIAREARAAKKIVTADPNPHNLIDWSGMTAVKKRRNQGR